MALVKTVEWDLTGLRHQPHPEEGPARTWAELLSDLSAMHGSKDGWDGEGSDAPAPELIDAATALAQALEAAGWPAADRAAASFDATIHLEWYPAAGYYEIEVESPREAEARWLPKGAKAAETFKIAWQERAP